MTLNEYRDKIHENAVAHGWWDEERSFGDIVALCHSELSEALEEYRSGRSMEWKACNLYGGSCDKEECPHYKNNCCECGNMDKPEGIAVEMADCLIRILDWCGKGGVDIDRIVQEKMAYNETRAYRHGGKKL